MTHAEFENLTGKKIDADFYRDIVEPAYMASSYADKKDFATAWNTPQHMGIIQNLTGRADTYENSIRQMAQDRLDLGYFIADQAEKWGATGLREKAIEILGERAYIIYKLSKDYNLCSEDRALLVQLLG